MAKSLGDITKELNEQVLGPAKSTAEELVRNAKAEAESIIAEAQTSADKIKESAKAEADNTKKQLQVDMDTAARNFIIMVQEKLEASIVAPVVDSQIQAALGDTEFLKQIIEILLSEFVTGQHKEQAIEMLLPAQQQAELESWFTEKLKEKAADNLNVQFTDKISFGFHLGEKGKGSHFNFSTGLVEAFSNFCSPRFRKHFFAHEES